MICYNISLYLYQNTNIIVMAYFRYNILISQYEYWKDQIKSHKFQIIQKFQLPNIAGNFILSIISNVLDVLSIKHFKISEIFGLWYRGVWYRDILILNIIQRHNFFQSFASIGRVDLVNIFKFICISHGHCYFLFTSRFISFTATFFGIEAECLSRVPAFHILCPRIRGWKQGQLARICEQHPFLRFSQQNISPNPNGYKKR